MKGDSKIIEVLNKTLGIELVAINQYFVQSKMCKNWGYEKLYKKHYEESLGEMKHAEALIDRILFLEGTPKIRPSEVTQVGDAVPKQFENDLKLEITGVKVYNEAIDLCAKIKDAGTREILEHLLEESEEHVDWLETQLRLIKEVGLQNYLSEKIGERFEK